MGCQVLTRPDGGPKFFSRGAGTDEPGERKNALRFLRYPAVHLSTDELVSTTRAVRKRLDLGRPVERVGGGVQARLHPPSIVTVEPVT